MLNALPDKRNSEEKDEVFLAPNEDIVHSKANPLVEVDQLSTHEAIDLYTRRPSSLSISKSELSKSAEPPKMDATVAISKYNIPFFFFSFRWINEIKL